MSGGMLRPFVAIDARPLAADGQVTIDGYDLLVKPAESARAYAKVLWSEGHAGQVQDSPSRSPRSSAPTVWAAGAGQDRICYGLPEENGTLRFRFHRGSPSYTKLVNTPGLAATIVVDRASSHIMSVRFHGRRT